MATGNRKRSATGKKSSSGRKTNSGHKRNTKKQQEREAEFTREVILWIVVAVSLLLFISNFGFGGTIGGTVSRFFFGLFGIILYLSTKHKYSYFFRELGMQYKALLILNLLSSLFLSRVDVYGHLGGLVGGYIATAVFTFRGDGVTKIYERILFGIAYIIVFILLFFIGIKQFLL